jgi:arylformamidase
MARYEADSAAARRLPRTLEDLAYGEADACRLDLFRPPGADAPLHVFLHGGYWQELSHKQSAVMARGLVGRGIALAVVNYTLAPRASLFDMVRECRAALAWLTAHGERLDVDASDLTLSGHSAGAHLAAILLGKPGTAASLAGALLISGIYDLEPIRHTTIDAPLRLGRDEARALSPLYLDQPQCPRVHLMVGSQETAEFHRQSAAFAAHLEAQRCSVRLDVVAGANHFDIICGDAVADAVQALHASA